MERRLNQPVVDQNFRQGLPLRLLQRAGIDRAVGFTILGRGWTAIAGLVTLLLLTRFLSPVQQGYYVTFGSVLGLSVFFELGLSVVLVQFTSHERAALEWTPEGLLSGQPEAKARLASLLRTSIIWYGVAAVFLVAIVLPLGIVFFNRHSNSGIAWQGPWIWIALVTGLNIALTPALAIIEGCGLIAQIARLQLWQNVLGSVLVWIALLTHWGLMTAPVTNTVCLISLIAWLWTKKRGFFLDMLRPAAHPARIDWYGEVWPLQWKVGLSYISGYFIFQMFNPILFATRGAAAAGQMGLSLAVMMTVTAVSIAWITTKASPFGTLVAQKNFAGLDRLFFPCLWQSWVLAAVGAAAVWGLAYGLHQWHFPISHRFLDPLPLGLLAIGAVANHGAFAQAAYLRAHKQEPFLWLALGMATLVALSGLLFARPFGAVGMLSGYLFACLLNLALSTHIFLQKRREWHGQTVAEPRA